MDFIIKDGLYQNIRISGNRKVTIKIENGNILSPVKVKYFDRIEVFEFNYEQDNDILKKIKSGLIEFIDLTKEIYDLFHDIIIK